VHVLDLTTIVDSIEEHASKNGTTVEPLWITNTELVVHEFEEKEIILKPDVARGIGPARLVSLFEGLKR